MYIFENLKQDRKVLVAIAMGTAETFLKGNNVESLSTATREQILVGWKPPHSGMGQAEYRCCCQGVRF